MSSIENRVKQIVSSQFGVDPDEVKPESVFVDDLDADAFDLIELVQAFEQEFGTEISDEDAEKMHTVQQAIDIFS